MSSDKVVSWSTPYVAASTPHTGDAWATEAASTGGRGTQRILHAGYADATDDVAAMLNLHPGDRVIARWRLILLDGQPVEFADAYYPIAVAEGTPLAKPDKIPGGAAKLLADRGYTAVHVHEEITARRCNSEEQNTLGLAVGDPVLILRRTSYTGDMQPFEAAIMTMKAPGRVLAYDLDAA